MAKSNQNKKNNQNKNKEKRDKAKFIRAYKKSLANMKHPKETSIPDPNARPKYVPTNFHEPDELNEMDKEIIELENLYGFGTKRDPQGNIITPEGMVIGPLFQETVAKGIIGRHFER